MEKNTPKICEAYTKELGGSVYVRQPLKDETVFPEKAALSDYGEWLAISGEKNQKQYVAWLSTVNGLQEKGRRDFAECGSCPYLFFKEKSSTINIIMRNRSRSDSIVLYAIDCAQNKIEKKIILEPEMSNSRSLDLKKAVYSTYALGLHVSEEMCTSLEREEYIRFMDHDGKNIATFDLLSLVNPTVNNFAINRQGTLCVFICRGGDDIRLWETTQTKQNDISKLARIGTDKDCYKFGSFSNNGKLLALLFGYSNGVDVWDVGNVQKLSKLYRLELDSSCDLCTFMSDGYRIIMMSDAYTKKHDPMEFPYTNITIWQKGKKIFSGNIPIYCQYLRISLDPTLICAAQNNTVLISPGDERLIVWRPNEEYKTL